MSVHYKFKSALDFDTITFDGLHINVADLKKAIIHQKRLGKNVDFDLQITNAQTKEEYNEDTVLIPKNTSLIIARIPLAPNAAKRFQNLQQNQKNPVSTNVAKGDSEPKNVDLASMDGSETDKINAMMHQSTADYDPTNYQKVRGGGQIGEVPPTYRCHRCNKPGHWIKNCPLGPIPRDMPEVKRNTGIPRSFIERDKNQPADQTPAIVPEIPKPEVPEDLICSICKDLFTDAVMIPCCGSSFCDECVRTALLESEDNECPDCQEKGTSPASLIPNRFLRRSVNNFKNETGYIVPQKPKKEIRVEALDEVTTEENVGSTEYPEEENRVGTSDRPAEEESHDHHDESTQDASTPRQSETYSEKPISSRHGHESKHYHESDEYAIRSTNDPYHHPMDNKTDGLPGGGEPLRHMAPYNMPQMHPYPNQPPYPHQPGPGPHMNQNYMMRPYNQHMPGYGRPPFFPHRGYGGHGPGFPPRNRHPYPDVSTIYQGVAQQVGTGIIDDPLEAFNRIMRAKERQKEEQARRRSPLFVNKYRRSRTPDRRRKRRSNSFEGSPVKRHFDRRVNDRDRKRRRSRSFSSSRSRSRSPPRKRSFTPRKYSKSPPRRSRSISQHARQHNSRNQRRDHRESNDRGVRKETERAKSPVSSRSKHKERHRSKTKDVKKKSRSRTPVRSATSKTSKSQSNDSKSRRKSRERTPHTNDTNKQPSSVKPERVDTGTNNTTTTTTPLPLEMTDLLPPGVEAFDDESWQTSEKYLQNKSQTTTTTTEKVEQIQPEIVEKTTEHEETNESSSKTKDSKKVKEKDKKRRKKEKDVESKKSKKHKRDKSSRDVSPDSKHQQKSVTVSVTETKNEIKEETAKEPNSTTDTTKNDEKTLTPPLITKSDSVLDLYDNIDLDIFGDNNTHVTDDFLTLPEPSKWELEEKGLLPSLETEASVKRRVSLDLVTSVAAKETKSKDNSPLSSAIVRPNTDSTTTTTTTVQNLQISVPSKATNHSERSIEIKGSRDVKYDSKIRSVVSKDNKETKKLSVKERLGEKVKEKSSDTKTSSEHRRESGKSLASAATIRNDTHKNDRSERRSRDRSSRAAHTSSSTSSHRHNSEKVEKIEKPSRSRATSPVSSHKKVTSSKHPKPPRPSTTDSSSSSDSDAKSKRNSSKKEKKAKKKRSRSKSSDESNTKKSNKKKSKKEKKKKSKHKS